MTIVLSVNYSVSLIHFLSNRIQDLKLSLITKPGSSDIVLSIIIFVLYAALALPIGLLSGFLKISSLHTSPLMMFLLMFSLFIMPSFLEELFFRVLLLPHKTRRCSRGKQVFLSIVSITVFIAWHPLNALTINNPAFPVFTNPVFLLLAALMAIACTVTYLRTGSIWIPVIIHWLTVMVWIFLLGGRNMVLDSLSFFSFVRG